MNKELIENIKHQYEKVSKDDALLSFLESFDNENKIDEITSKLFLFLFNDLITKYPTSQAYTMRGFLFSRLGNSQSALTDFENAILLSPKDYTPYNLRGNIFLKLNDYSKALIEYNRAIKQIPNNQILYYDRAIVYSALGEILNAINDYTKAIDLDESYYRAIFNRGILYKEIDKYPEALIDFKKHIKIGDSDYRIKRSQKYIKEIQETITYVSIEKLEKDIANIKDILLFEKNEITHYTGLSVSKLLISNKKTLFRLSESNFLNDTSEGLRLYKFLTPIKSDNTNSDAIKFIRKPFIGSFVSADKSNDLTLWRMYAKENQQEAKGCSLTFNRKVLIEDIKSTVINEDKESSLNENNFKFYRVAYLKKDNKCIIPGTTGVLKKMNTALEKLKDRVEEINKKGDEKLNFLLRKRLSEIQYLFKGDEYSYESEIRLVMDGIGIEKKWSELEEPPKVYIEIAPVQSSLKSITIGPKVERGEEWAALFNYQLNPDNKKRIEIQLSQLPFK